MIIFIRSISYCSCTSNIKYTQGILFSTPKASNILSNGQNFVKDDCNKLTPTKTPNQSQRILTKKASAILINTKDPATYKGQINEQLSKLNIELSKFF